MFFQALGMTIGIKAWADDRNMMLSEASQRKHQTTVTKTSSLQSVNSFSQVEVCVFIVVNLFSSYGHNFHGNVTIHNY